MKALPGEEIWGNKWGERQVGGCPVGCGGCGGCPVGGWWLVVVGCWVLLVGCWVLVVGCLLLVLLLLLDFFLADCCMAQRLRCPGAFFSAFVNGIKSPETGSPEANQIGWKQMAYVGALTMNFTTRKTISSSVSREIPAQIIVRNSRCGRGTSCSISKNNSIVCKSSLCLLDSNSSSRTASKWGSAEQVLPWPTIGKWSIHSRPILEQGLTQVIELKVVISVGWQQKLQPSAPYKAIGGS